MCTTHPSSISSSVGFNQKDYVENDNDSLSYFDNASDKEKEENFFKELDSDSPENIIERSKDGQFGKVNYIFFTYFKLLQFDDILGIGTFKKVFKGYDFNCGREIAWIEINIEQKNPIKKIPKIIENVEKLKNLKHPNLLEYFSGWYEESINKAIIITELLQGGNLKEHRKYQKKLKIKLIKKWIKQILLALDYLHSNGYIHHDIKSQNILVDRITGNLKLGDLISIEKISENGYFSKYIGTEEFMAPEVKEGKYTFKADIYSLGITIIQVLTMERPFKEFRKKENIYEAKKKGLFPLSFNQINNKDIQDFISLCLKKENLRPSCKELLENKWLNDTTSKDNNLIIDIINNLRKSNFLIDKKNPFNSNKESGKINNKEQYPYNLLSPFTSSNSLYKPQIIKLPSMGPIYSLDISKLNSGKIDKDKNRNNYLMHSFRLKNPKINPSVKCIKSGFSFMNLNDKKVIEKTNVFSDRVNSKEKYNHKNSFIKMFKERNDSSELIRQEDNKIIRNDIINNNSIIIYGYIIENEEKLIFSLHKKQEKIENCLLQLKIVIPKIKWKKKILFSKDIIIKNDYKKDNIDIIINFLGELIELNLDDLLLIKNKLGEKVKKIIKEKKINDLKEKINEIVRNFEFLINNEEFDILECLINSDDFNESKLPKNIIEKLKYYKEKKINIENLFTLYNVNVDEDYNNNNNNLYCQDYVILNINE